MVVERKNRPAFERKRHPERNGSEAGISGADIRRIVLEQSRRAGVGHIGSALSIADIIAALYSGGGLRIAHPDDPDRDRFILSKGHAVLALYAALQLRGWLPVEQLDAFCGEGTLLGVHPEHALAGVDFSTGSLGHGLSIGAGAALAARMQSMQGASGTPTASGTNGRQTPDTSLGLRRVAVLVSDAECNEGSVWEAVGFAAHHRLSNLIAVVDLNGQQALGYTREVLDLSPMAERWRAFRWDVHEVDGHNIEQMQQTLAGLDVESGPPHVLIAHTTFGKGVPFMERQIKWHYLPMSEDEYRCALAAVEVGR